MDVSTELTLTQKIRRFMCVLWIIKAVQQALT